MLLESVLSTADGVNDFDRIAGMEVVCLMGTRRHDLAIHFYSQALSGQTHQFNKARRRCAIRQLSRFSVYGDLHDTVAATECFIVTPF